MRIVCPEARPYAFDGKPCIYAVYHGSMIVLLSLEPRSNITILISNSRDGEIIARGIEAQGFRTARGSAGRGGVKGTLELIDAARAGQSIAFMVDGPRGPREEVKIGIVRIAQMTGLPIVPVLNSSRTAWWTKSWDRFQGSSWGCPMLTIFGEPLEVPQKAGDFELEQLRARLERRMLELHEHADTVWEMSDGQRTAGLFSV